MPGVTESLGQQSAMQAALDAGIEQVSASEQIAFRQYVRVALAPDQYVFWVASDATQNVTGSLHYSTDRRQDEDQTIGANEVLLSSESEIAGFNQLNPQTMWIGSWPLGDGQPPLQVAFAARGRYYDQANVWHYRGFAVYPALAAQLVNSAADLPAGPIVSNSLPIWLALGSYYDVLGSLQSVPVFPAYLVPDNATPPYVVAYIDESQTQALGAMPLLGPWPGTVIPNSGLAPLHALASSQLSRDEVRLTLYGFTNLQALQFLESLVEESRSGLFGFANSPIVQDDHRIQREIAAIAQKKTISISANYLQSAADVIARRLILQAGISSLWINGVSSGGFFSGAAPLWNALGGVIE